MPIEATAAAPSVARGGGDGFPGPAICELGAFAMAINVGRDEEAGGRAPPGRIALAGAWTSEAASGPSAGGDSGDVSDRGRTTEIIVASTSAAGSSIAVQIRPWTRTLRSPTPPRTHPPPGTRR